MIKQYCLMKKILLLSAAVLSILALASCQKEMEAPEASSTTIRASLPSTKTALGQKDGTSWPNYWKTGDQISVNGVASQALGSDADGKSTATFTFDGEIGTPYYAAYPVSAVSAYSDGSATLTVPARQLYVEGSYDPAAFVMFGKSNNNDKVALSPCVSLIHLSLSGSASITRVKLTGAAQEALSGSFTTDFSALTPTTVSNIVELVALEPVALPAEFFICVPAGLEGALTVEIFDSESGSMTKSATLKKALVAGEAYSPATLEYVPSAAGFAITAEGITSSTAIICVDGAAEPAYTFAVYSDEGCSTLVDSYAVPAESACWGGSSPRFCVSGLAAGTTYYVKVTNVTSSEESIVLPVETAAFDIVEASETPAAVGDVILAEDFGELRWDSELINRGVGYFPTSQDSFDYSEVDTFLPIDTNSEKTLGSQATALDGSRLAHWAQGANNNLYIHPGYIKLVGSKKVTHIVTPALDNIPDGMVATIEVEVTACPYYSESSSAYATMNAIVAVQPGGDFNELISETKTNTLNLTSNIQPITLEAATAWKSYKVTLSNVAKGDRIAFGAASSVSGNDARMNLSDIKVTITALKEPGLSASVAGVSTSTAAFRWTYGGEAAADIAKPYKAALYRNEACTDLVVSYDFDVEEECWDGKSPCFVFGGLQPSTDYWFKVTDIESGNASDPVSVKTDAFTVVDATTVSNASVGDVILGEDFSEIAWNSDDFADAAGFMPSSKVLTVPSGVNPEGSFVKESSTGDRIFGAGWNLGDSRLSKGWGFFGNSAAYYQNGFLRVSTSSSGARTHIVTPALSGIPAGKVATIEVTVTACKYESNANDVAVFVEKELKMSETEDTNNSSYRKYTNASLSDGHGLGITAVKTWETKSVTIANVDSDCQLVIGSLQNIDGKNRFYLSDVTVTVTAIKDPGIMASVAGVSSSTAAFRWTYGGEAAADIAKPYTYALYRNQACTDLIVSFECDADASRWDGKSPCFVFGGLQPSTTYWFQVKDNENGNLSDPVSATTEAFTVVDATTVSDAAVGDVILAEDFSEIAHGPDELAVASGFVPAEHNLLPAPSGVNPDGSCVKYSDTGNRIFGSGWDLSGSRLDKGWGFFGNSSCYTRNGYLRVSASNGRTHIVTPALSGIPVGKVATIEVTVTACKYESNANDVAVFAEKGITINSTTDPSSASFRKYTGASLSEGYSFGITAVKSWQTKSVTITNVEPDHQLIIGSLEAIDGKNRFYLSDIQVKITALDDDPVFTIADDASFNSFVSAVAGGNKTLEAKISKDITLSAATVEAFATIEDYEGTLNGYDHTISGLTKPMFNELKGTVKDLILNSTLNITADQLDLGILANVLSGTADGCTSQGSVSFNVAGGVTGEHHIAGLIGQALEGSSITGCTNEASVTNYTSYADGNSYELMVGGVLGTFWGVDFTISDCENTGAVINNGAWNKDVSVGGIIGQAGNSSDKSCTMTVTSCTNSGAVTNNGANADATNSVGGVIGWIRFGTYTDNSNTGTVTNTGNSKQNRVGGLIGYLDKDATFDGNSNSGDVSNTGEVTDINYVGGLLGRMQTGNTFKNNSNSGTVTNTGDATNYVYVGGIVGYLDKNNVIADAGSSAQYKLTNSGNIVNGGSAKNICIGGLFGRNSSGYFNMTGTSSKYSTNSGNITDNSGPAKSNGGDLSIGGIAGYTTTGIKTQYARNSGTIYVTGDKGSTAINVGGIGGWISNASFNFNNCRNTGDVIVDATTTGSIWAAGIVGCPKPNTTKHYYWYMNATIDTHLATVGGENYTAGLMATVEGSDASSTFTMIGHKLAGTVWGSTTTTGLFCCTKNASASFSIQKGDDTHPCTIAPGTVRKDNTHDDTINDITDVTIDVLAGGAGSTYDITSVLEDEHLVVQDW